MSDGRSLTARCAFAAAVASCLIALRLITLSAAGTFFVGNGAAALTALDSPYVQTFDSLASAGTSTSLPVGWAFWESGSSAAANGLYAAGTGSGNAGDVYSFGSAGGTDRAFGTLLSGTLTPIVGGSFTNSTGAAIGTVTIAYTGEQWRLGTAGRADRLDFQYSLNAVDLTSGAWVDVNALDFSSPTTVGSVGALNGNLAANRTAITSTITGLDIPPGATFWIRWTDADASGADDGLAVDDFSLTPHAPTTDPTAVGAASPASVPAGTDTTLTVRVTPGTNPTSTGIVVTGDLQPIGGAPGQPFFDDGTNGDATADDNVFSVRATVAAATPTGLKNVPVDVFDSQGRHAGAVIAVDVQPPPPPPPPFHAIHEIQGPGTMSPLAGSTVTTRGIVTARKFNGFFIQMPDAEADADPDTSEGVFVFTSSAPPPAAAVGNLVDVIGAVQEFVPSADANSPPSTEIVGSPALIVTVDSSGNPLPVAVTLTAADTSPTGSIEQLERFEGMRVHVDSLTVIAPTEGSVSEANATSTSNGVFFGVITGVARPFREPGVEVPDRLPTGSPMNVPRFDANPERLRVDSDALLGAGRIDVTTGAIVSNITGVLDYGSRAYTILPDPAAPPSATGNIFAIPVPAPAANQFRIGSANLERFFDTTNDPGVSDVALTATAFGHRLNKASLLIRHVMQSPDIVGVVEMENAATLQSLAAKINSDTQAEGLPDPQYTAYLVEGNDIGGIDVGFLVKSTRVAVVDVVQEGKATTYVEPGGATATLNDRPPLILRGQIAAAGDAALAPVSITVIVNHLRSLSGIDDPADGARVRAKRRAQAEFLAGLIQARQTANPDELIVSIGDYNAFQFSDGYVDVMGTIEGHPAPANQVVLGTSSDAVDVNPDLIDLVDLAPPDQRYSFMFDGNAQELDHVLISSNMLSLWRGLHFGRANADFPEIYRNDPDRPERVSDHDPLVASFELPQNTTTSVGIAPSPAVINQDATFTATIGAAAGTVEGGTVDFKDGGTAVAALVPVAAGHASIALSLAAGDHTITAEYHGAPLFAPSASAGVGFTVVVPVLTLPPNQLVEAASPDGAAVTFSASAYDVVDGTMPATCVPASGTTFPIGTTVVTCSLTDPHGNTLSGQFNVTVQDTTPPDITALFASPSVLWPANHQMVPVVLSARTADLGDASPACAITSIASSEPANATGDGNSAADMSIAGAMTAALRAERAGNGPGRTYTIAVRCVDRSGNAAARTAVVSVPHSSKQ